MIASYANTDDNANDGYAVSSWNSSVRYEIGIYLNDKAAPAAVGHFVHVYVERASNRPVPIPDQVREVLTGLSQASGQV